MVAQTGILIASSHQNYYLLVFTSLFALWLLTVKNLLAIRTKFSNSIYLLHDCMITEKDKLDITDSNVNYKSCNQEINLVLDLNSGPIHHTS